MSITKINKMKLIILVWKLRMGISTRNRVAAIRKIATILMAERIPSYCMQELKTSARDKCFDVREAAIAAGVNLRTSGGDEILMHALGHGDIYTTILALRGLAKVGYFEQAVELMEKIVYDMNIAKDIRKNMEKMLRKYFSKEGYSSEWMRNMKPHMERTFYQGYINLLQCPQSFVKHTAIERLNEGEGYKRARYKFKALLKDSDPYMRVQSAKGFAKLGDYEPLIDLLNNDVKSKKMAGKTLIELAEENGKSEVNLAQYKDVLKKTMHSDYYVDEDCALRHTDYHTDEAEGRKWYDF